MKESMIENKYINVFYSTLNKDTVCAGIVLYNPQIEKLNLNLTAIIPQFNCIYLIDNNSKNHGDIQLIVSGNASIKYYKNTTNVGIASALNQLIDLAINDGYNWLLTLDQDSICSSNIIDAFLSVEDIDNVGVLCPYILNNCKTTIDEYTRIKIKPFDDVQDATDCITSGSLMNLRIAKVIGCFKESLFIDCVDFEYNIRILKNNFRITRVNTAYLIQEMGTPKKIRIFSFLHKVTHLSLFRRIMIIPEYNDIRLYYMSRNSRYVRKMYKYKNRVGAFYILALFIYFLLFYPLNRNRLTMMKSFIKGFRSWKDIT